MPAARAEVGVGAAAGEKLYHLESSRASCPWPVQEGVSAPLSPYCMNVEGSPFSGARGLLAGPSFSL